MQEVINRFFLRILEDVKRDPNEEVEEEEEEEEGPKDDETVGLEEDQQNTMGVGDQAYKNGNFIKPLYMNLEDIELRDRKELEELKAAEESDFDNSLHPFRRNNLI